MSSRVLLEGLGYLASVLIAISLMMRSIVRLRWINLIGAACFTAYGIAIGAYPVAALNFAIVLINVYFLWKSARRSPEAFSVVEMEPGSPYVAEFLSFFNAEIQRFQPGFRFDRSRTQHVFVALRDLVPAGMVIAEPAGEGTGRVTLDFVTPAYRDFRVGQYVFGRRRDLFTDRGWTELVTAAGTHEHETYLARVGFLREGGDYRLALG